MANGAFTGGVKPGGLTSTTEVRNLLCYVIRRVSPLSRVDSYTHLTLSTKRGEEIMLQ